eukprot:jgi/Chrzof1/8011/UNPLg00062.t1
MPIVSKLPTMLQRYCLTCLTENRSFEVYSQQPPTACPFDASHVIDPDISLYGMALDQNVNVPTVVVREESQYTQGNFRAQGVQLQAPPGVSQHEVRFPYNIAILAVKVMCTPDQVGDTLAMSMQCSQSTTSQDVLAGSTMIPLTSTDLLVVGSSCKVGTQDAGEVVAVYLNRIDVSLPLQFNVPANSPVTMTYNTVQNYVLVNAGTLIIGDTKIGGIYVPGNTPLTLTYNYASTTASKALNWTAEILY